jgi:hypothetical protein
VRLALEFHDQYAGSNKIDLICHATKITDENRQMPKFLIDLFQELGISRKRDPIDIRANVLPFPKLLLSREAMIDDGSWKIDKLHIGSKLNTFAVIDLTKRAVGSKSPSLYLQDIYGRMEELGLYSNLPCREHISHVLETIGHDFQGLPHQVSLIFVCSATPSNFFRFLNLHEQRCCC